MTFMYFIPAYPCRPAGALLDQVASRALNFVAQYEANAQAEPKPRRSYCRPHPSSLVSRHKSVTMQNPSALLLLGGLKAYGCREDLESRRCCRTPDSYTT